jgi:hypothetical protein
MAPQKRKDALLWGIILIIVSFFILLDNLGFEFWDFLARSWPVILIIWGAWKFYLGIKESQEDKEKSQV